jgi:hypothetical protein
MIFFGEIHLISLGSNLFFVTFRNDFLGSHVFILCKINLEVCNIFNISRLVLNWLSTPRFKFFGMIRVGNFLLLAFIEVLNLASIHRKFTQGYTPHQNGVSEHKNKTFFEKA